MVGGSVELEPLRDALGVLGELGELYGLRIGRDAVLIADAAVHPTLLDQPGWRYESDHHERSAETRRALVR